MRDVTYEFAVSAFTNMSADPMTSDVVSYTVGPPSQPRDLKVDVSSFPKHVLVSWTRPSSPQDITVYVVMIAQREGDVWNMHETKPVNGKIGSVAVVCKANQLYSRITVN